MGKSKVAPGFQIIWVAGRARRSQIGELWHVRDGKASTVRTPLGHLAIFRRASESEAAAHWRVECFLRDDIRFEDGVPIVSNEVLQPNYPASILDDVLGALLRESRVDEPVVLYAHLGRNVDYRQKGSILDDD